MSINTINISFLSLFFFFVPLYLYLKKLDIIKSHFQISIISSFRKNDSNFASRKILNEADRVGRFEKNFQLAPFIPCSFHFVNDSDKRGREGREMWLVIEGTDVISITHKPPGERAGSR